MVSVEELKDSCTPFVLISCSNCSSIKLLRRSSHSLCISISYWLSSEWNVLSKNKNPFQINLWSASYIVMWSQTDLLYCLPLSTAFIDPHAMTLDSTATSRNSASLNLFLIVPRKLQIVWDASICTIIVCTFLYFTIIFQWLRSYSYFESATYYKLHT